MPAPAAERGSATVTIATAAALVLLLVAVIAGATGGITGQAAAACTAQPAASRAAAAIPANYRADYHTAGTRYGIPWTVLAGIGTVESGNGRNDGPSTAGALGPMQFLPSTWHIYGDGGNINNPAAAIPAAARLLLANGAPGSMWQAIFAYNHSAQYVSDVLDWAARYAAAGARAVPPAGSAVCRRAALGPLPAGAAGKILAFAEAQLGKPYQFSWGPGGQLMLGPYVCPAQGTVSDGSASATGVVHAGLDLARRCASLRVILYAATQLGRPYQWGGTGPGAFDCSGLTMMAYRAAGMYIPRTSQQQWVFGRRVPAGEVKPGDLVFFAGSDGTMTGPGHVGIVLGEGMMIDAPFTGVDIRIEPYSGVAGLVGFTRPG